jgi:tetratricopeptide (TPR) repeat protein
MGKVPEAVTALNAFLEFCPTDPEAWAELADMYVSQGLYAQAIYALEEVLVFSPNAWNVSLLQAAVQGSHGNLIRL